MNYGNCIYNKINICFLTFSIFLYFFFEDVGGYGFWTDCVAERRDSEPSAIRTQTNMELRQMSALVLETLPNTCEGPTRVRDLHG